MKRALTNKQRAALAWLHKPVGNFNLHSRVWNNLLTAGLVHQIGGRLCLTAQGRQALRTNTKDDES